MLGIIDSSVLTLTPNPTVFEDKNLADEAVAAVKKAVQMDDRVEDEGLEKRTTEGPTVAGVENKA